MNSNFSPDNSDFNEDEILNKIFENVSLVEDYREIRLPSLGMELYDIPTETVSIRGMTFEDEKILAALKDKTKLMEVLIERCVKEDINPKDLLPQDKIYLMIHIRALSVGETHKFAIACPSCNKKSEVEINVLETFPCKFADTPLKRTSEIMLPKLGKKAVVKRVSSYELDKFKMDQILQELWRFVISIDGHTNAKIRAKVMDKIPREDVREILNIVMSEDIGLDTKFMFGCASCGHEELTEFAFQNGFFTMT
jgi:transcription antitermination factor NusG